MTENPYQSPAADDTQGARKPRPYALAAAGLVLLVGLLLAVLRAAVTGDWLLALAILLMVAGSWMAARIAGAK